MSSKPIVSVCVPYWKRQGALDDMFEEYGRLYPDLDIEFSVCDDGNEIPPTVPSGTILTTLPRKDIPLNACVPINAAINASTADIIVLTNPENRHKHPVLQDMLALVHEWNDYVTAPCWDETLNIWIAGPAVDYTIMGRVPVPPGSHYHFLAMFTRELWEKAGGFDEEYRYYAAAEDGDWLWRADAAGANFKCIDKPIYHKQRKHGAGMENYEWNLPHGKALLHKKWPQTII